MLTKDERIEMRDAEGGHPHIKPLLDSHDEADVALDVAHRAIIYSEFAIIELEKKVTALTQQVTKCKACDGCVGCSECDAALAAGRGK
jgi:hypothetical protein